MAAKLTLYEQETVINFNREEKTATLYSADPVVIRRMDRLCEEQPDIFQITDVYYYKDSDEICSKTYLIQDKKQIRIMKKREYTEEQLMELRERGQRLFASRKNTDNRRNNPENT